MSGAIVQNTCVNKSEYETTLLGDDVYLGFMLLSDLNEKLALEIISERNRNGNYNSLEDFINRVSIGVESIQLLIFTGAFRFTGRTKNQFKTHKDVNEM